MVTAEYREHGWRKACEAAASYRCAGTWRDVQPRNPSGQEEAVKQYVGESDGIAACPPSSQAPTQSPGLCASHLSQARPSSAVACRQTNTSKSSCCAVVSTAESCACCPCFQATSEPNCESLVSMCPSNASTACFAAVFIINCGYLPAALSCVVLEEAAHA